MKNIAEAKDPEPAQRRGRRVRSMLSLRPWLAILFLALVLGSARAADQTWDGGPGVTGTAWLTATNWLSDLFPGSQTVTTNTDAGTFTNVGSAGTIGINLNFTGNTFYLGAVNVTGTISRSIGDSSATPGTLQLNGATVNGVSNVILRNSNTSNLTLDKSQSGTMKVVLGNATTNLVNVESSGLVIITSDISGTGKTLALNASSTGDLRLSGTNTYTGGTNVTGGTGGGRLRVDTTASLPTTGTVAVSEGGRITLFVAGTYGGTSQALTFNPNQTANPSLDNASNTAVTWQGTVALNADTRIEPVGATGSITFSNTLSGTGTLVKQGLGNLILSGTDNSATGGTTVNNGLLTVNAGSRMGTGDLTLFQSSTNNTAVTLNNATQNIGNLSSQFTSTSGTRSQILTLNDTALNIKQTTTTSFGTGAVSTLTSVITGSGSITLNSLSTGRLNLTGANPFTGTTTVSGGTLAPGATNSLQNTSRITLNTGGTLLLAGSGVTDRIGNTVPVTLAGGTFNTGGLSERNGTTVTTPGVGALTLSSNSVIDFTTLGTVGANSILAFDNSAAQAWNGTLSIYNYTGTPVAGNGIDQLFFGTSTSGLTATQLAEISFYTGTTEDTYIGSARFGLDGDGEVVPVPEPATLLGGVLLLAALGWHQRRRLGGALGL